MTWGIFIEYKYWANIKLCIQKIFYNLAELDAVYIIKLIKVIEVLDFKPPIIENSPYNTDFKDNKIIESIEDIQRN